MLLSYFLAAALATSDEGDVNASDVNVSVGTNILIDDYTNTLLYYVTKTKVEEQQGQAQQQGGQEQANAAETYVIEYVPTLLKIVKAYEVTPTATPYQELPPATAPLKIIIFKPGILIGCSFGIVFLVGFFYTEFCRRPQHVYVPPAKEVESSSDSSLSSLEKKSRTKAPPKTTKKAPKPGVKKAASGKAGNKAPVKKPGTRSGNATIKTQGRSTRGKRV